VADLTHEQLVARPVPGKWSTLEVVAHIADFEPILADRIKRIASHDNPTLLGADENLLATLFYQDRNIDEELDVVDAVRASVARTIRQLPDEALHRTGTHNEIGVITLGQLLGRSINHISHHVAFIREKRKALGLDRGAA